jgi:hypothetical protein
MMVINMEWGGFGSHSAFQQVSPPSPSLPFDSTITTVWLGSPLSARRAQLPFHDVDNQLDALSPNEGSQR